MNLTDFNSAPVNSVRQLVRPCADIDRWIEAIVSSRPYADLNALLRTASNSAFPFTSAELATALAHHPRIGDRAAGSSSEARMSRTEQSGVSADQDMARRLSEGNAAYEERFDRVFLIRAAGRSAGEILESLEGRLRNNDAQEFAETATQLREIAVLRLRNLIDAP
ncbi:2-oxo-4-hydroxy-4-carboxy-5-ureidoimidazoline decarboxylase [Paeniglutamicibacter cryotolerans]|uniref:2-oxo-4-hydroxy-4-carboxy-5-ureidoimidazoline decarboxylase n=1 Tax=Paeniglutamicibacter cryotolerans TaxID=670079 RepID=A0A839QIK4_9MICC|nr:2-oxo-4-hydroxy-4-carboxy-5-ureidoimidazoline decarboxylase [Paeniglutamicibacter cryotolerans]MBB2994574.1 2-oxo-4-hydroxy-4-carboxy-5-ureidoimidazoline decarboxylase [Paeniglutamicibacter cryotolerans]